MKKFMWLILLASALAGSTYGASAEAEPTTTSNPPFYRLQYQQDGKYRYLFILGTAHRLPLSVLPPAVRAHIGEGTWLLSELGLDD